MSTPGFSAAGALDCLGGLYRTAAFAGQSRLWAGHVQLASPADCCSSCDIDCSDPGLTGRGRVLCIGYVRRCLRNCDRSC
jgi:hypothetical protein